MQRIRILLVQLLLILSLTFHLVSAVREKSRELKTNYVEIRLALKHEEPKIARMLSELDAVSYPSSQRYGQHLNAHDIGDIIGTSHTDLELIRKWLETDLHAHSISIHATRDYIDASVPAPIAHEMIGSDANKMKRDPTPDSLQGRFQSHPLAQRLISFAIYRQSKYLDRIRAQRQTHSKFADWKRLPTRGERLRSQAKKFKKQLRAKTAKPITDAAYGTPANQLASYGVPIGLVGTNKNNTVYVWGTGTYGFQDSDLQTYYSGVNISASELNLIQVPNYGGVPGGDNFGEGTLDISLITGLAPGLTAYVSNTDTSSSSEEGDGFGPAMLAWITSLIQNSTSGIQPLPSVISLSLGSLSYDSCYLLCEGVATQSNYTFDDCSDYMQQQRQVCMYPSSDGINRMNVELAKLGLMGTTVSAATGDGGSHFSFQFFNNDPIGNILNSVACASNFPTFPAESPYVVGVGGTEWATSTTAPIGWSSSGGGFSWRFPRPAYQDTLIPDYFEIATMPPLTAYNRTNRAYPDVATLAENVPVVIDGGWTPAAGTSCAAPEWSALLALINDARLNAGLSTLGYLNPTLYRLAEDPQIYSEIFYDMSVGNSDCDVNGSCCNEGTAFQAAKGWDATTGLGSPLFPGLLKYLGSNEYIQKFQKPEEITLV